ncbi:MAG: peptidoglycan-binding protein [Anaerohalosphaeraceae bacterium]|nr:peptidoglycan-binding protein [Anaerohalosphaeraceae bacterium]
MSWKGKNISPQLLKSNKFWIFLTILLFVACIFLSYAIYKEAEISSSKDCWLKTTPMGNEKIEELEQIVKSSIGKEAYNKLLIEHEKIKAEHKSSNNELLKIANLVAPSEGNLKLVFPKILELFTRTIDLEKDVKFSFSIVRSELDRNGTINTKCPAEESGKKELYKHIQKCLSVIGTYNSEFNGNQVETRNAVMEFQLSNNLKVDGIIGKNTWASIIIKFEQEKLD